jgi:hypothetical protein
MTALVHFTLKKQAILQDCGKEIRRCRISPSAVRATMDLFRIGKERPSGAR